MPLFVTIASFFTGLNMKLSVSILRDMSNALSMGCDDRSKSTDLKESSERGKRLRTYSKLEKHFASLSPQLPKADIRDQARSLRFSSVEIDFKKSSI